MLGSIISQFFLATFALAITQTCVFETSVAEGYVACDPNASQGTCCDQGEACLESGLCSGSLGIVYRGACINEWSSDGCVTYCADKSANWANLYPCTDGTGSSAPAYWWCGNDTDVTCSKTSGTVLDITPGVAIKLLTSSTTTSSTATSTSTSSPTTTANVAQQTTSSASTAESCHKSEDAKVANEVAAVGAGVGASLGALSLAMLALFLNERRRRKKVERAAMVEKPMGTVDHYATENKPSPPYVPSPHEMGESERLNELGPSYR